MKILAVERETGNTELQNESRVLADEASAVYAMYLNGNIREIYFTEMNTAVLILECRDTSEASGLLGKLPLVQNGLISFEISELRPYTGFSRLMQQ
ncbi:MAG: hypothetical protein ACM3SM_06370 [Bacteroidota bacterium]